MARRVQDAGLRVDRDDRTMFMNPALRRFECRGQAAYITQRVKLGLIAQY
jgi:hypothetical protein